MNPCAVTLAPDGSVTITASGRDTETWSRRPGMSWPCSTLAGHNTVIRIAPNGDLLDLVIGTEDVDVTELAAFADDMLELSARYLLRKRQTNHSFTRYLLRKR